MNIIFAGGNLEIRDPIHGNIKINETEMLIIDTPQMQRLRRIKQLDLSYLVYPGANHTRFEHSIGTMHVTKELFAALYKDEDGAASELGYVAMLHDLGHGPFSHVSDPFIEKYLKKTHEVLGEELIRDSEIKDIISGSGINFGKFMKNFRDSERIGIVAGPLGSDRIDYLMRDSHYTGVAYGIIDYERIKSRIVLHEGDIAIDEGGTAGAESMLISRYFMHLNVYSHHTKIIAAMLLKKAIALAFEEKVFDGDEFAGMYDEQLVVSLLGSKNREIIRLVDRITNRRLFKRAYYDAVGADVEIEGLADSIVKAGFGEIDFGIQRLNIAGSKDEIQVIGSDGKSLGKLTQLSPFMKTLTDVLSNSGKLLVACDKKNVDRVRRIVENYLA